mmetsp:Transcript_61700/g.178969  ORF Transcript_61700/g.178969 Transcript_61700/m.178969 type:complete len:150 (-) Transcript_61700:229-678(-)
MAMPTVAWFAQLQERPRRREADLDALAELASRATAAPSTDSDEGEVAFDFGPDMSDQVRGVSFVRGIEVPDLLQVTFAQEGAAEALANFDYGDDLRDPVRGGAFIRGIDGDADRRVSATTAGSAGRATSSGSVAGGAADREEVATPLPG